MSLFVKSFNVASVFLLSTAYNCWTGTPIHNAAEIDWVFVVMAAKHPYHCGRAQEDWQAQ